MRGDFEEQLAKIRAEREEARKQEVAPEKPQNFVEDSEQEFDRILSGMKSEKKRAPKQDNLESIFSGGSNIFEDEAPKAPEKADRNAVSTTTKILLPAWIRRRWKMNMTTSG